jgi:hypothetical protein
MNVRDKMDFGNKIDILADLGVWFREDEFFSDFLYLNDLGVPLAVLMRAGGVESITDKGSEWIHSTWEDLCELLGVDPYGEYENVDFLLGFSDAY